MNPPSWCGATFASLALALCLTMPVSGAGADQTPPTPLKPREAKASSSSANTKPAQAVDGVIQDGSRWVSAKSNEPSWLELDLDGTHRLAGLHLYTGYQNGDALEDFVVQFWKGGQWHDIPSATFENNKVAALAIPFDDTVNVTTDRLRLWITKTPKETARVLEVVVWPYSVGKFPPLAAAPQAIKSTSTPRFANEPVPLIYLNQSGFNLGEPKRFTAPTLDDGTAFQIRPADEKAGQALFTGTIQGHIGDFTAFNPTDEREYVVVAGENRSVPFRVGPWWLERVTYQNAVDFMIESRHYVGNVKSKRAGSYGWRDDHHFGWELKTLVAQYLSNPSAYERMPHQVQYEAPNDPKLWGRLEPYKEDAPDIVKLIHWGADVIVSQGLTHELFKSQLADFLYAWPWLKAYLPQQNYDAVRDFAFEHWSDAKADQKYPYDESAEHDLLQIKTKTGSTKGCLPPGFSIQPNLMLYAVAKREGRADAETYFQAAYKQAQWMIANLDWNDPLVTKGQRVSEFVTMTGLAYFLQEYPDRAPAGLAEKINAWAAVMIRRSNNLWDFRKLDDADGWVPKGQARTMWNEPGNVVGFPAALLAAEPFVTDAAARTRLEQLVWSHFDDMFGRNPTGRCFSFDAPREIEGVEHGWYTFLAGGVGQLAEVRFVLDGGPKNEHYPYHPEVGNVGWTEGWVQFNTPFNESLAYLAHAKTRIELRREGDELLVRLEAPLNFDYAKVETGKVWLTTANGDAETLVVTEESPNSRFLSGRIKLDAKPAAKPGDGAIQAGARGKVEAGYGYGYLGRSTSLAL